MNRLLIALAACAAFLFLPACAGFLTATQRDDAKVAVQEEYVAGHITAAQRDAAIEALDAAGGEGVDWEGLGIAGINILLGGLLGVGAVRIQRGPPTQKVGLPAAKVIKPVA